MTALLLVIATGTSMLVGAQPQPQASLPDFPSSWSVRESQHAVVEGTRVDWDGMVYNDANNISRPHCNPRGGSRNCSVTAYVDDRKQKTTYHFYEPNRADRGYVYYVQPGTNSVCYCDMATLGTWLQCEIAESLCNPNMIKSGRMGPSTTFNGEPVDSVQWFESLIIASSRYNVLVKQGTATPVQYNTSFLQHGKQIGFNEVNMTDFSSGTPDPASVDFGSLHDMGSCEDYVCQSYGEKIQRGVHPVAAFPPHF